MESQWCQPFAIRYSLFAAPAITSAGLQRRGGGRATRAGTLHVEIDDAVLEAAESDVAAVIGDRRAHPCFDQILDHLDGFGVGLVEEFAVFIGGLVAASPAV